MFVSQIAQQGKVFEAAEQTINVVKMFSHATSGTLQVLMWTKPVGLFKPSWMCFRIVLQCLCDYFHKHNCKCEVVYCSCSSLSIYSDSSTYVCTYVCVCVSVFIYIRTCSPTLFCMNESYRGQSDLCTCVIRSPAVIRMYWMCGWVSGCG